jgi:excisionase family DNA binding protein
MHAVLPVAAVRLLRDLLREMAQGHAVSLVPMHAELTTQQAADSLNVSRPYVVKLLESGALPHRKVGTHRRVRYDDLLRYKHAIDAKRLEALKKLQDESEELGLYD